MNPPSISWNEVATALNITERSDSMPFTIDCPMCKTVKSLTLYQNTTLNAGWHHCKACGKYGDLFDFTAYVLGMSLESAFVELAKRGVPSLINLSPTTVQNHANSHTKIKNKANRGWTKCEAYLKKPTTAVNELLVLFNLQFKKWENFQPKIERYIGATHVKELEKELGSQFKHLRTHENKTYEYTGTLPVRFQKGWGDVLVLPYETAPGLIVGFLCVGHKHGKIQRQFTRVRITNNTFGAKQIAMDAGLWGLHAAINSKSTYSDYAIALEDPLLALRIQSRHALMSNSPLPIVSWFFADTESTQMISWSAVPQKNIVVVTTKITPSAVHAAYKSGGLLTVLNIPETGLLELIKLKKPEDLIKNFVRQALPWKDVLRKWMASVSPNAVTDFFNTMQLFCKESEFIEKELSEEINAVTPAQGVKCVRVYLDKHASIIIENNNGWFFQISTTEYVQLTDFTIKLKTIYNKDRTVNCEGMLYYKDHALPISFSREEIKNTKAFEEKVIDFFLENNLGFPKINTGEISLMRLAHLFHAPKIYKFPDLVFFKSDEEENSDLIPVD